MQHGIITRRSDSTQNVGDATPNVLVDQSQMIILQDRLRVMQKRNVVLIAENKSLRESVGGATRRSRELEDKCAFLEKENDERQKRLFKDRGNSPDNFTETIERGTQAWAVCRACEGKFEKQGTGEANVIISKSMLDSLESDLQALRDAVLTRETEWTRATEREACYREHLTRSTSEALTARLLAETRYNELEALARSLAESDKNLKSARKEISGLKKIIAKQETGKRQVAEDCCKDFGGGGGQMRGINETEQKWIDDIVRQLSNPKNKHRSKLIKDRAHNGSGRSSNGSQASPRVAAAAACSSPTSCENPVTVTEMLALSK